MKKKPSLLLEEKKGDACAERESVGVAAIQHLAQEKEEKIQARGEDEE